MAFVYLLIEEAFEGESIFEWVKIGYTKNPPEWRVETNLTRGNPRKLIIIQAFEYTTENDARAAEKAAHKNFKEKRYAKEWFNVNWRVVEEWLLSQGAKPR